MILTTQEVSQYKRDGYLVLERPVLDPGQIAAANVAADTFFADWASYPKGRLTGNIRLQGDSPGVSGIMGATTLDRKLAHLPMMETCRKIASELMGTKRTWFHFDHVVSKDSGDETEVHWHQDFAYSSTGLTLKSVHFWIPLQSVDAAHGSMVYLPGSHLTGLREHQSVSRTGEVTRAATVEEEGLEVPPVQVGGLVCHDPMTLHYSKSNRSGQVRRAWVLHFGVGPWPALREAGGPILAAIARYQIRSIRSRNESQGSEVC